MWADPKDALQMKSRQNKPYCDFGLFLSPSTSMYACLFAGVWACMPLLPLYMLARFISFHSFAFLTFYPQRQENDWGVSSTKLCAFLLLTIFVASASAKSYISFYSMIDTHWITPLQVVLCHCAMCSCLSFYYSISFCRNQNLSIHLRIIFKWSRSLSH